MRFVLEGIGCVQWHMLEAPAGIAKRANPSCALKQTFRLFQTREHTRLAERWAGKACRRGSLRWLLLRASVSCDAQQLIALSHRAPNWTSATLLRSSRLPVATLGRVTAASAASSGIGLPDDHCIMLGRPIAKIFCYRPPPHDNSVLRRLLLSAEQKDCEPSSSSLTARARARVTQIAGDRLEGQMR